MVVLAEPELGAFEQSVQVVLSVHILATLQFLDVFAHEFPGKVSQVEGLDEGMGEGVEEEHEVDEKDQVVSASLKGVG